MPSVALFHRRPTRATLSFPGVPSPLVEPRAHYIEGAYKSRVESRQEKGGAFHCHVGSGAAGTRIACTDVALGRRSWRGEKV